MLIAPPLLAQSIFFLSSPFLVVALLPAGDARFLAAASACYFLVKTQNSLRFFVVLLVFIFLGIFYWGALFAGVLLFSTLIAELWASSSRMQQCVNLLMAVLCMTVLLFCSVPSISIYVEPIFVDWRILLLLLAVLFIVKFIALRQAPPVAVDPLIMIMAVALTMCYLLMVALFAGSIAYSQAISLTTAGGCIMLATVVIITAPLMRGGTLSSLQHIFVLHVPIEKWVADISQAAAEEDNVVAFSDAVMQRFLLLPGVIGVAWRLDNETLKNIGTMGKQNVELHCPPLFIRLYRNRRASPWDWFNYYLLARISGEYCRAKQREESHRADNLSRAIHQTGARLTHDIKNILHTLSALTQTRDGEAIKRQLPALCERLESTLTKLQVPATATDLQTVAAEGWWHSASQRYAHQSIHFSDTAVAGKLPPTLFDLALDNFIANALIKRQIDSEIRVSSTLLLVRGSPALQVEDSGAPVAAALANVLFQQPVDSDTGFGVALYQVRVEAKKYNYEVELLHNSAGKVIFQLAAQERAPL
ncbi:MAG: hypothetical protein K0U19_00935 [Proteobacteria bacterium]|nr:hypothetical protein [Pseudomonadota bacterium]